MKIEYDSEDILKLIIIDAANKMGLILTDSQAAFEITPCGKSYEVKIIVMDEPLIETKAK